MTFSRKCVLRVALAAVLLTGAGCKNEAPASSPVERARQAIQDGNGAEAELLLRLELEGGGSRTELTAFLGEAALLSGDLESARNWLGGAEFAPDSRGHGLRMLGRLEMAEGDLAAAGRSFDAALTTAPPTAELWVDIGRLRYRGGEQVEALGAAERALELDPDNPAALQFRGQLARDIDGLTAGARWFGRALQIEPENRDLRVDYAASLGDAGSAAEALAILRSGKASAVHPRALYLQAVIAARGGKFTLSRDLLLRSDAILQGIPAALLLSAILDLEEGNPASAAQTLDRLAQAQPDNRRIAELLAFALSRSGGERELVHRFAQTALEPGASPYLQTVVGRAYEALGQRARAAQFLDAAARAEVGLAILPPTDTQGVASPVSGSALRDAIRAAIAAGDPRRGATLARRFLAQHAGSADMYGLLGDAELANGSLEAARAAYRSAARVRQSWPLTLRMLAAQEDPAEAEALLADYLAGYPANTLASALFADAAAAAGEWERAAVLLDHAIGGGMERVPWVLAARNVAAHQLGDGEGALQWALAAHELQPMNRAAVAALLAALPEGEHEARDELEDKLASLDAR